MPDPLMDTLDEIDRKSGKSGTFLLSKSVPLSYSLQGDTLGDRRNVPDYSWI